MPSAGDRTVGTAGLGPATDMKQPLSAPYADRGRQLRVDLTHHNTNRFVTVEGPVIAVRAVAKRQVKVSEGR